MTLSTHALAGAMAAEFAPNHPVLGFILGFASHLAIDSLPHYDYSLSSAVAVPDKDYRKRDLVLGWKFLADLIPIGIDCIGGFILAAALFAASPHLLFIALLGAFAGVLPDFLQFVYFKTHSRLLTPLQRFHLAIQSKNAFEQRPLPGLAIQFAVLLVLAAALRFAGGL